jgi:hypothetical protein
MFAYPSYTGNARQPQMAYAPFYKIFLLAKKNRNLSVLCLVSSHLGLFFLFFKKKSVTEGRAGLCSLQTMLDRRAVLRQFKKSFLSKE